MRRQGGGSHFGRSASVCPHDAIRPPLAHQPRPGMIMRAGIAIILLGVGAAATAVHGPSVGQSAGRQIAARRRAGGDVRRRPARPNQRFSRILAGAVTTPAGSMFIVNPVAHFVPTITIVTAWLLVRSVILASPPGARTVGTTVDRYFGGDRFRPRTAVARWPVDFDADRDAVRARRRRWSQALPGYSQSASSSPAGCCSKSRAASAKRPRAE